MPGHCSRPSLASAVLVHLTFMDGGNAIGLSGTILACTSQSRHDEQGQSRRNQRPQSRKYERTVIVLSESLQLLDCRDKISR